MRFNVTITWPKDFDHAGCVSEVAETLAHGLRELGHEAEVGRDFTLPGRHIILLPNLLEQCGVTPPEGSILYNLEQIVPDSPIITPGLLDLYKRYELWDYSAANCDALEAMGIPRPKLCPVGWLPSLDHIRTPTAQDIDVLFYGYVTPRRAKVLMQLGAKGYEVMSIMAYGEERDAYIARAKVLLNLHAFDQGVFEIVRNSYLMGNGKVVVSETGVDPAEQEFAEAVAFADYDHLAERCVELLADPEDRRRRAKAGRRLMASRRQADYLSRVL